ncbi:MAG: hypothetical protein Ct9H90mP16_11450 [Candidatus Poseidoniales archaeon]|nr:MAG: hypothetical protein Ct9H90mP16_11450 [Candidatus Poseidoniales archaeon]
MGVDKIRFPNTSGIGIKPISSEGTARIVRAAIQYAIDNDKDSVTLVHKGNIMKFTEGGFRDWGYELAQEEFGATLLDGGPWCTLTNPNTGNTITIKDVIADAMLQQVLTRPREYGVLATMNLNGDYISDALAAQVGALESHLVPTSITIQELQSSKQPTELLPSIPGKTRSIPVA